MSRTTPLLLPESPLDLRFFSATYPSAILASSLRVPGVPHAPCSESPDLHGTAEVCLIKRLHLSPARVARQGIARPIDPVDRVIHDLPRRGRIRVDLHAVDVPVDDALIP